MALDLPIQDFPGPTFLNSNNCFGHWAYGASQSISMSWIASRKEMMVLDQLNGFRSTNPGLPRTHFSQLQQTFWPQGLSANFHVLDCKQKRNDGPALAQWLQIYRSRTSQDSLFSTLSCFGLRAAGSISMSWIASRKETKVLDQLNGYRFTKPGLPRTHFSQL